MGKFNNLDFMKITVAKTQTIKDFFRLLEVENHIVLIQNGGMTREYSVLYVRWKTEEKISISVENFLLALSVQVKEVDFGKALEETIKEYGIGLCIQTDPEEIFEYRPCLNPVCPRCHPEDVAERMPPFLFPLFRSFNVLPSVLNWHKKPCGTWEFVSEFKDLRKAYPVGSKSLSIFTDGEVKKKETRRKKMNYGADEVDCIERITGATYIISVQKRVYPYSGDNVISQVSEMHLFPGFNLREVADQICQIFWGFEEGIDYRLFQSFQKRDKMIQWLKERYYIAITGYTIILIDRRGGQETRLFNEQYIFWSDEPFKFIEIKEKFGVEIFAEV